MFTDQEIEELIRANYEPNFSLLELGLVLDEDFDQMVG